MSHTPIVIRLYRQGLTLAQIAIARAISRETVRRILLENGVKLRPRGRRKIQ